MSSEALFIPNNSLSDINLPKSRLPLIIPVQESPLSQLYFNSIFREHAKPLIEHIPGYFACSKRSFPVFDSFSEEEINKWGEPLVRYHLLEMLTKTQKDWGSGEIVSVKGKSRDKKNNRIGFSLTGYHQSAEHWIKVTSDGNSIFITKDNGYHRVLDINLIGNDVAQEKLEKILSKDTKRLFGEKPDQSKRTYLQPILQTAPSSWSISPAPLPF